MHQRPRHAQGDRLADGSLSRRIPAGGRLPILLFLIAAFVIVAAGYLIFAYEKQALIASEYRLLAGMSDRNLEQVEAWRRDREADARRITENPIYRELLAGGSVDAAPAAARFLLNELKEMTRAHYRAAAIIGADGTLIASEGELRAEPERLTERARTAFAKRAPLLVDARLESRDGDVIRFQMFAPIFSGAGVPLAVLVLQIDPGYFLDPVIALWPVAESSGEALLVRVEGERVLYLTWTRNAVRATRAEDTIAGKLGRRLSGRDYRGERVLAVAELVPETPWRLVTKIDESEVLAHIRELALYITLVSAFFLLLGGALVRVWWRKEIASYLIAQYETERHRRDLENKYDFFARYANDPIILADDSGRIIDVNDRALEKYGYTRDELKQMEVVVLRHPDHVESFASQWRRLTHEEATVYETIHRKKDGSFFPVEVSARVIAVEGHNYFQAIVRDITERKEAEEALRRSEERLSMVLEGVNDGYWDFNIESGETYFSARFAEILGYEVEELRRSVPRLERLIHPEDAHRVRRAYGEHLRGRTEYFQSEHRMRRRDGTYLWVLSRGRAVRRSSAGQPLRVAGALTDIDERKHYENQVTLWALVYATAGEAIFITDKDRRIISVNPAFSEITGYGSDEVAGKDPHIISSGEHDRAFYQNMWAAINETGHWQGEIWDRRKNGEVFPMWTAITASRGRDGDIQNYIAICSDISERKAAEERIQFLAHHDALTKLPNRILLQDRLTQAIAHAHRTESGLAVLFVDLDRFKNVNDSFGHQRGDELLKMVGERLSGAVRVDDTVSRLGGDEFLVLLVEMKNSDDVAHIAQKVIDVLAQPYTLNGSAVHVSASVGISMFPDDGADSETLIRNADSAMYYAKERGRNNFQFFVADLNQLAIRRLSVESSLRRAVDNGEFVLHYQPQIDANNGTVVGLEALIRWKREGALVGPTHFIPLAEEAGLILPIGEWVLREACRQQKEWRGGELHRIPVAVNFSATQFHQKDVLKTLGRIISGTCFDPRGLEIELTEATIMQDAESSISVLHGLKGMGISLAIDDFGTGYSSLNYLRRFPIDRLKVDQSFVHDLNTDAADRAITEAIIALAKSLGLRVIAEGVENAEEMTFLRERGCDELQGFYFSPPLPPDELGAWLSARQRAAHGRTVGKEEGRGM